MRSNAYYDGFDAGEMGYPYENPYYLGEDAYDDYEDGWETGHLLYLRETEVDL
jgi:hypothetical protein